MTIESVYLSHKTKHVLTRMKGSDNQQDPTIDENSAKQEKWHETSQSMWLIYSAQNLLFTGTVFIYYSSLNTTVRTIILYMIYYNIIIVRNIYYIVP